MPWSSSEENFCNFWHSPESDWRVAVIVLGGALEGLMLTKWTCAHRPRGLEAVCPKRKEGKGIPFSTPDDSRRSIVQRRGASPLGPAWGHDRSPSFLKVGCQVVTEKAHKKRTIESFFSGLNCKFEVRM